MPVCHLLDVDGCSVKVLASPLYLVVRTVEALLEVNFVLLVLVVGVGVVEDVFTAGIGWGYRACCSQVHRECATVSRHCPLVASPRGTAIGCVVVADVGSVLRRAGLMPEATRFPALVRRIGVELRVALRDSNPACFPRTDICCGIVAANALHVLDLNELVGL